MHGRGTIHSCRKLPAHVGAGYGPTCAALSEPVNSNTGGTVLIVTIFLPGPPVYDKLISETASRDNVKMKVS